MLPFNASHICRRQAAAALPPSTIHGAEAHRSVLAALAKYGKGQATDDVPTSVRLLLDENLLPNLPPIAVTDPNTFRTDRMYCEDVDLVLKKHSVMLKLLYSRYRLKPVGGGLRPKMAKIDGWMQLMGDACMVSTSTSGCLGSPRLSVDWQLCHHAEWLSTGR
jgi:hypothetical protein